MGHFSDWITPDPVLLEAEDEQITFLTSSTLHAASSSAAWSAAADGTDAVTSSTHTNALYKEVEHNFATDPDTGDLTDTVEYAAAIVAHVYAMDWANSLTDLPSFPDYLDSLVLGTDYDVIPGTSDYVEWETSEGTIAAGGYLSFSAARKTGSHGNSPAVDQDVTTAFMLNQVADSADVYDPPVDAWYPPTSSSLTDPVTLHNEGDGTSVATTTGGGYDGTWDVQSMLTGTRLTVAVTPDGDQPPDPTSLDEDVIQSIQGFPELFSANVQYPRFRYWIPTDAVAAGVLRQRQRGDTLAGAGAPRQLQHSPAGLRQGPGALR